MKLLEGKVALITGGSRGIGRAIATKLAHHGTDIVFTGRSLNDNTESLERELQDLGVRARAYASDASDFTATSSMVDEVIKEFGHIDILVNNAGITRDTLLMRMSEEQWDEVLTVNLKSAFILTRCVIPHMMRARKGSIINMTSVVGISGNAGQSNYSASKAGIIGFTKSIAKELGSRGIRVNAIAPGFIRTDMTSVLDDKVVDAWVKDIPLKRAGEPADVANAVLFLASDLASYITGEVLNLSGGMVM